MNRSTKTVSRVLTRKDILGEIRREANNHRAEAGRKCGYIFEIHPHWTIYGGDFNKDSMAAPRVVQFLLDELDGKFSPNFKVQP